MCATVIECNTWPFSKVLGMSGSVIQSQNLQVFPRVNKMITGQSVDSLLIPLQLKTSTLVEKTFLSQILKI